MEIDRKILQIVRENFDDHAEIADTLYKGINFRIPGFGILAARFNHPNCHFYIATYVYVNKEMLDIVKVAVKKMTKDLRTLYAKTYGL